MFFPQTKIATTQLEHSKVDPVVKTIIKDI